jgi:hypothetical protein
MSNEIQPPQWAIIELMGHVRYGGQVSKDTQLGTAMLRVDVPMPDGSTVSQLVNPASLYRITFCAEALAREAAKQGDPRPMHQWEVSHLLPAPKADPQRDLDLDGEDA